MEKTHVVSTKTRRRFLRDLLSECLRLFPPIEVKSEAETRGRRRIVQYPKCCIYEGEFDVLTKKRHGEGKFTFYNGYSCEGTWVNDRLNGPVVITSASRRLIFEGRMKDNEFYGRGVQLSIDFEVPFGAASLPHTDISILEKYEQRFEGEFSAGGLREGKGTIFYSNGERFVGIFHKDLPNGKGEFLEKSNSTSDHGVWLNGRKQ